MTQRSYEFVRPERFRKGLGRLLGIGILVAEGDEHKVWKRDLLGEPRADKKTASKESSSARFCFPPYQGSVSRILGEVCRND